MTTILAIDPGTTRSAFIELLDGRPFGGIWDNETLLKSLADRSRWSPNSVLVVEMVASYGMPVGREVFETCVWIGRFVQAWGGPHELVYRRDVKLHLCGQARAKDANVRQAVLDRFGGKEAAVGRKATPGPLYGLKADSWQALALPVTYSDRQSQNARGEPPIASCGVS